MVPSWEKTFLCCMTIAGKMPKIAGNKKVVKKFTTYPAYVFCLETWKHGMTHLFFKSVWWPWAVLWQCCCFRQTVVGVTKLKYCFLCVSSDCCDNGQAVVVAKQLQRNEVADFFFQSTVLLYISLSLAELPCLLPSWRQGSRQAKSVQLWVAINPCH